MVSIEDHEKCIKQSVPTAAKNVKFHSSQQKVNLFIAKNVLENEEDSTSE